jgi:putative permease
MQIVRDWFRHHFSDPEMVILAIFLTVGSLLVLFMGKMLAPVLASLVIAYLLQGPVALMEKHRIPHLAAVLIVFLGFIAFLLFLVLGTLPLLWQQVEQLFHELPNMIAWGQRELLRLPERYPDFISEQQVVDIINVLRSELSSVGQRILSLSVASVRSIISVVIYIFLLPLLVFFFLKDKDQLLQWIRDFLPEDRRLAAEVWHEVDRQIGNYIRGKVWEILILWAVSYAAFSILGLQFAMLISFFVGLSVLVPYIGATAMGFPVASIGYFQWGWSSEFAYVVIAYVVIQILDGNLLAFLLFSEVVNLHPVAIIVAILAFGGIWGFWGVFFAIPLATLVEAVLNAWSRQRKKVRTAQAQDSSERTAA